MNINKALKTEYYRPHQLIKHEHICIYLFINCFWIDIWISSLLNWYLCKFSCCHLHHKTPSNFEHLETSPVFAIPTSPSKPQKYYPRDGLCQTTTAVQRREAGTAVGACSLKSLNHRRPLCPWGTWVKPQKRLRRVDISQIREFVGKKKSSLKFKDS